MNKFIMKGRLTKDPDVNKSRTGTVVAKFTLAVDRRMSAAEREKAQSNNEPTADFVRITAFNKLAETAEKYLAKGSPILVEGRVRTDAYLDKSGAKKFTTDFIAQEIEFLGGGKTASMEAANDDDISFTADATSADESEEDSNW